MICYVHTVSIFITNQFACAKLTIPKSVLSDNKDKYILLDFFCFFYCIPGETMVTSDVLIIRARDLYQKAPFGGCLFLFM